MTLLLTIPRRSEEETRRFPNYAGRDDVDGDLERELDAAGAATHNFPVLQPGEVKTQVFGSLHGWLFKRAWRYWVCEGPGLDLEHANWLYDVAPTDARVAGDCSCPAPAAAYEGLGVGVYHCDNPFGLRMLVAAIEAQVMKATESPAPVSEEANERNDRPPERLPAFSRLAERHIALFNHEGTLRIEKIDETAPEGMTDLEALILVQQDARAGCRDAICMLTLAGRAEEDPELHFLVDQYLEQEQTDGGEYVYKDWAEWDREAGTDLGAPQWCSRQAFEAARLKKERNA